MIYKDRDKLTAVRLENETDRVSFDILARVLLEKPANMIYFVLDRKLFGMISMGDIARASEGGADHVMINKKFTWIRKTEYMKAKKIFRERKNINALPVISEKNELLGEYIRWDNCKADMMYLPDSIQWICQSCHDLCLVLPNECFDEKKKIFERYREFFVSQGVKVVCTVPSEIIKYLESSNWILFVDEDELRAMDTLYKYIYKKETGELNFYTYKDFAEVNKAAAILKYFREKGVYIFNLFWECNTVNSGYVDKLYAEIASKYASAGERVNNRFYEFMNQGFFDDLYSAEYADCIKGIKYQIETQSGCGKLKDSHSEVYNVTGGERYTYGQPESYVRTIYFVGACYIYGHYAEDKNTIESFLQKRMNQEGYKVRVVNCGSPAYSGNMDLILARILTLPLKKGDIIICGNRNFTGVGKINLMDACYKHNVHAEWMVDHPMHCNHRLHSVYADAIYDTLQSVLKKGIGKQEILADRNEDFIKTIYLDRYFKNCSFTDDKKTGSIVMNCNPFTYGHRYLIEQAVRKVDFLIIFVVQENQSLFSFDERFAMVCEGTADLNNVMVVPSGPFILSNTTFPEYFIKAADEDIVENVENDIKIFAKKIAPHLKICYRFLGEEPEDMVTNEYNKAMKRILPDHGIELIEIPRKECNGRYISASLARKYIENYDLDSLRKLVPESTMRILDLPITEKVYGNR